MPSKQEIEQLTKKLPKTVKIAFGTFAGMVATAVVHPLDLVKVRLQICHVSYTTREMTRHILRCEGTHALFTGLSASLMRQATNTTTRLTTYHILNEYMKQKKNVPLTQSLMTSDRVMIGLFAGLVGAFAGNPSEVALVRMMADGPRVPCSRCWRQGRYRGVFHAFYRIATEEGVHALWRGGLLTLYRSVCVSAAQIGVYAEVNAILKDGKVLQGFPLHWVTSLASSFVTTVISLPIDLIKTRYQVRSDHVTQREILNDVIQRNGVWYLWKGTIPYFARLSFHTISTLMIFELLTEIFYYDGKGKT